ncbi:hypothetical protein D3C80_1707630 [compost metagenome]
MHIGHNTDLIPCVQPCLILSYRFDNAGKLMTKYPRVAKKRLIALIGMQIRSTDSNPANADDGRFLFQ